MASIDLHEEEIDWFEEISEPSEVDEPELKKPKLEAKMEGEDDDDFNADDEYSFHEMTPKEWQEYIDAINKSGGFDVPSFPKSIFYGIQPCGCSDPWEYVDVKNCSIYATKEHNKLKCTNYEFYRLIKVNAEIVAGSIYYITFLAEDLERFSSGSATDSLQKGPNGGPLVEFQAKVFLALPDIEGNTKMECLYTHVKDNLSEEGLESHLKWIATK